MFARARVEQSKIKLTFRVSTYILFLCCYILGYYGSTTSNFVKTVEIVQCFMFGTHVCCRNLPFFIALIGKCLYRTIRKPLSAMQLFYMLRSTYCIHFTVLPEFAHCFNIMRWRSWLYIYLYCTIPEKQNKNVSARLKGCRITLFVFSPIYLS